jgi:hypothetical protein
MRQVLPVKELPRPKSSAANFSRVLAAPVQMKPSCANCSIHHRVTCSATKPPSQIGTISLELS